MRVLLIFICFYLNDFVPLVNCEQDRSKDFGKGEFKQQDNKKSGAEWEGGFGL